MCVAEKRAGRWTHESWWNVLEPGPDDSLSAQQWPLWDVAPFSFPLCALIGRKCSCLMFGCLASFLLLLNAAWLWSLGSGVVVMKSHIWGGASFPVWTIMSGSGMFATNPHLCPPGRNWSWPDSNEEEELSMTLITIGWWTSGGALCWTKSLNADVN